MSESEIPSPAAVDTIEPEPELAAGDPDVAATAAVPEPAPATPAEQPAAAPVEEPDPILVALERLDDRLEESQRLLARQSEIATSLHAENQRLKAGELLHAQLPLVRDIIRVHDVLGQVLGAAVESTAAADLEIAREAIVDALARNGIEKTQVAAGDALDPRQHKIMGIAATDDPAADRTVAEVMKAGFVWDGSTTIRAADVRVYKHTAAAAPAAPPERSPDHAPGTGEAQT